jgi:putative transposase
LRAREDARAGGQRCITDAELFRRVITQAKKTSERAWLGEVSAVVLQQALADLNAAYRNFFDSLSGRRKGPKVGPPRFRSRRDNRQSIRFTRNARFKVTEGGKLCLPKIGDVKVRWSRELAAEPSSVTLIKDAADRYFASFVIDTDGEPLPPTDTDVGIDLGLNHFAVLSDGRKISNPRWLRRRERKLKRAQRALSRKQKDSKNRGKARKRVARQHAKVADARREFHHQLSTWLIRENQAVYAETLNVKGLARGKLAKSVHDAGWSAFVAMLETKAARYGRVFARVDPGFPSSQICSKCQHRDGPKPLKVRTWTCPQCHTVHDRDINASVNVRDEGRRITGFDPVAAGRQAAPAMGWGAETQNACGDLVRPPFAVARVIEAGTHQKPKAA